MPPIMDELNRMTIKLPTRLLFWSILLSPAPAFPGMQLATAGDEEPRLGVLEHVRVTATRSSRRDIDIAPAVTTTDEAAALRRAPDVIAALLRGEAGVFFQQTTPGQGVPIIRGLKGSQVLHTVDGMRLNNAFFRSAPNQYLGLVDPFAVRRVEVVRGSQGALYGADAMGGVVSILTTEPEREGPRWRRQQRLYGSYDSVDQGLVTSARAQGGSGAWGFAAGASYQDHASRRSGDGTRLVPSGYRSRAADLKLLAETGERSSLMLSAQVMTQPSTPRYDELVAGFGRQQPASRQFRYQPNRRSFIHARFRLDGGSQWLERFEAHAARQVVTDDRLTQAFDSQNVLTEHNRSTLDGVSLQLNSQLPSGRQLVWGAEYYTDSVASQRFEGTRGTAARSAVASRFPDGASMDSAAVFLSADWLTAGSLDVSAGLRYSWFDITLPATGDGARVTLTPADVTGDLHFVYALSPGRKLVANLGRGFRPPNIFDLATLGPRPGNRFNVASPGLGPESVRSYDLGLKTETQRVEMEVFAYYLDYADRITAVLTGEVRPDGRAVIRSENLDKAEIYGLEAKLYWLASPSLSLSAAVNYTRGAEWSPALGARSPADRIPPLNGKVGLEYLWRSGWRIEPYVLFAGRQDRLSPRDVDDPRIDPAGTPGWATLNLSLEWQATASLQLGLRLENLTDAAYREHGSGIDAAGRNIGLWLHYNSR